MKQKNGMLKLKDLADISVCPWSPKRKRSTGRFPYIGIKGETGFCDTANFEADSIVMTRFGSGTPPVCETSNACETFEQERLAASSYGIPCSPRRTYRLTAFHPSYVRSSVTLSVCAKISIICA